VILRQLRLRVESVDVRWPALGKDLNHPASTRHEMRRPRGCSQRWLLSRKKASIETHAGEADAAEAEAKLADGAPA
jgi:hypothetical protein